MLVFEMETDPVHSFERLEVFDLADGSVTPDADRVLVAHHRSQNALRPGS